MAVRNEKETPRKATREPEKRMSKTETPRRTGGGGSAALYGTGGSLNGGVRKTFAEPEKRMNRTETPRTMQEAHKEMRRRIAEDHKQSISRERKK